MISRNDSILVDETIGDERIGTHQLIPSNPIGFKLGSGLSDLKTLNNFMSSLVLTRV